MIRRIFATCLGSALAFAALACGANAAHAQSTIKQPGDHPHYTLELEPHLVAQYGNLPYTDDGLGLGVRVSVPFVHNGPISTINNNIGMSFGLDWVHFGDDNQCNGRGNPDFFSATCSATELWFPVTAQWNFFLTKIISVFGELGLSGHYARWDYEGPCNTGTDCRYSAHYLNLFEPVLWAGGRFLLWPGGGLTVRLGWPYISFGASFLL